MKAIKTYEDFIKPLLHDIEIRKKRELRKKKLEQLVNENNKN